MSAIEIQYFVPLSTSKDDGLQYNKGNPCQQFRFLGSNKHDSLLRVVRDKTTGCWAPIYLRKSLNCIVENWASSISTEASITLWHVPYAHAIKIASTAVFSSFILLLSISVTGFAITLLPLTGLLFPRPTQSWALNHCLTATDLLESQSSPSYEPLPIFPCYPVEHSLIFHHLHCF